MVSEKTADVARRAKQLYEVSLQAELEATNLHDFVAIEPDSPLWFTQLLAVCRTAELKLTPSEIPRSLCGTALYLSVEQPPMVYGGIMAPIKNVEEWLQIGVTIDGEAGGLCCLQWS